MMSDRPGEIEIEVSDGDLALVYEPGQSIARVSMHWQADGNVYLRRSELIRLRAGIDTVLEAMGT